MLGNAALIILSVFYIWHNLVSDGVKCILSTKFRTFFFPLWEARNPQEKQVKYSVVVFRERYAMTK